jgi:hypothetical protein
MAATKITSRVLADDAVVRATLGDDAIGTAEIADDAITSALVADDIALGGNPTTTTQSTSNSSTRLATTAFVQAAVDADINALIDSAPGTMNTLDEIAAALNDDPTFTTTVNNAIALKATIANPTFTGNATFDTNTLYVDGSNNRIGIGNTAPDVLLEVAGAHTSSIGMLHVDSSDHAFISLDAASSSHDKGIYFQEAGTAQVIIDHDGSANLLRIHDGSNTHMVIEDGGNVGIGTTSPSSLLNVSGATARTTITSTGAGNNVGLILEADSADTTMESGGVYYVADNTADSSYLSLSGDNANYHLSVTHGGKVGIGTNTPESYNSAGRNLVVVDSGNTGISLIGGTSSTSSVMFGDGTGGTAAYRGAIKYDHSVDDMIFWSAAAEKIRFTADGEIGIGGANYGTDGQVFTSGGAGAAAAWEDAGGGGASDIDGLSDAKSGGTNFTSSLILGHQTTGTLSSAHYNTAVGYGAMDAITQGDENVCVGYQAGTLLTTGVSNALLGSGAGGGLVSSGQCVAVGGDALRHATGGYNVAVGYGAGAHASNTATWNTFLGYLAGNRTTSGSHNTYLGRDAGYSGANAAQGVAVGGAALYYNQAGNYNVAVGYSALMNTGSSGAVVSDNTAVGFEAGKLNVGGAENTYMGKNAGRDATSASYSTGIGSFALGEGTMTGAGNTAVGRWAGKDITSGTYNVMMGYSAGQSHTTGGDNVYIGGFAGQDSNGAANSIAIGRNALTNNVSSANNIGIGFGTLIGITGSENGSNVCIGTHAGRYYAADGSGDHGSYNTVVGYDAGQGAEQQRCVAMGFGANRSTDSGGGGWYRVDLGMYSGQSNYGSYNISIGYGANSSGAGGNNIFIGTNSSSGGGGNNTAGAIAIGHSLTNTTNNRVAIGNSTSHIYNNFNSNASWTHSSDERMKKDIASDTLGLSFINDLRTVTYKYKAPSEYPTDWDSYSPPTHTTPGTQELGADGEEITLVGELKEQITEPAYSGTDHGLIAQEVKAALDTAGVDTFAGWGELPDGKQSISREMFVIPLIKAVQELSTKNNALEARILALESS